MMSEKESTYDVIYLMLDARVARALPQYVYVAKCDISTTPPVLRRSMRAVDFPTLAVVFTPTPTTIVCNDCTSQDPFQPFNFFTRSRSMYAGDRRHTCAALCVYLVSTIPADIILLFRLMKNK